MLESKHDQESSPHNTDSSDRVWHTSMHAKSTQTQSYPKGLQSRSLKKLPLIAAGGYFLATVLWIFFSDRLLAALTSDPTTLTHLQSVKGIFFVGVTSWIIYWLLHRALKRLSNAEAGLRESEERLQLILQNMPVMLGAFDDQNRMIVWNHECERVTGFSAAEMIGNPQAMTLLYPEATYRQKMVDRWTELGNDYRDWEWEMTCRDGSVKTVAWSNIADHVPIPGWKNWGIGVDVTDRKQAEAALRARNKELLTLHKLSEIILQQQSLKSAFQAIVKEISVATGFPIVAIELYDAARQMMVFEGTEGIPLPPDGKPIEVPVSQTASGTVVQTGQMLVKTYEPSEPKKCDSNKSLNQLGLKTFICVPMTVDGITIGTLSLGHPDVVETQESFLQWLTSLTNYLALLTAHQRTGLALHDNEEFFKLALDFTNIGSWDWRVTTNQVIWDDNHTRLLGFVPGEVQASYQAWRDRVHPDDIDRVEQAINEALTTQTNYESEYRILHPDGSLHWITAQGRGIYDAEGQVTRMLGFIFDITDRKHSETALRDSEEQFRSLSACSPVGIYLADPKGYSTYTNPRCREIFGFTLEESSGRGWANKVHPDDREWLLEAWSKAAATGEPFMTDYRIHPHKGIVRWVQTRTAPMYTDDGTLMGHVGTIEDITERRQSEEALRESETLFRSLSNSSPIGIYLTRTDGYTTYTNPRCQEIFGFTLEESLGDGWLEWVHADDREALFQAWYTSVTTGKFYLRDYRVQRRDGAIRWVQTRAAPMHSDDGELIGYVGTIEDITDRKQAEQQIRTLNQTLEQQNLDLEALVEQRTAELMTFINTLPDYIFVVERDTMRMAFCNELVAKLIGWESRHQVAGKTIFECYEPDLAATFAAQNQQVFDTGETLHFQETYTTPLGTLNFDTYKIPLKKPNGEVYALIGTSRDITELVEARQTLADRTVQLEAANRELESFSYSVSHDLRAPLRHITGFVAALTDRLDQNGHLTDPKVIHYLQILQNSSQTMGQLIDGLLTLSRVGRRQKAHVPVDLNQVVAAVLAQRPENTTADASKPPADDEQPVRFYVGKLPTVTGDATLLQQVFANLIDNAVKFSRVRKTAVAENGHPVEIEIGSLSDGIIFVRDHGVGFQMEYADQLFGAFQRLHSRSEFEGNGIGLAIVQRIIHRHGGKIWAESQPNEGATFYFQLGDCLAMPEPFDDTIGTPPPN